MAKTETNRWDTIALGLVILAPSVPVDSLRHGMPPIRGENAASVQAGPGDHVPQ
jgi:hypothetical protein